MPFNPINKKSLARRDMLYVDPQNVGPQIPVAPPAPMPPIDTQPVAQIQGDGSPISGPSRIEQYLMQRFDPERLRREATEASQDQLMAGIGRAAGGISGALAGVKPDNAYFDNLSNQAQAREAARKDDLKNYLSTKYKADKTLKADERFDRTFAQRDKQIAATGDLARATLGLQQGKEKAKQDAKTAKLKKREALEEFKGETILNKLNASLKILDSSNLATGWAGKIGEWALPGSSGNKLAKTLDTIRANLGFDRLQEMRDSSPTGGALGQVSEMENKMLQAAVENLDTWQSEADLRRNLINLQKRYKNVMDNIRKGKIRDAGGETATPNAPERREVNGVPYERAEGGGWKRVQ